jgi:hypothetical protein
MPDAASIAAIRWQMARLLVDHCSREGHAIYDTLRASGDVSAAAVAGRYWREHGADVENFGRYITAWPVKRVAREWTLFGNETRVLAARLIWRIECEEAELYRHAERVRRPRAA